MEQRQLRLGDILDDYCPRERRITDHAVVAMVGDRVQQTRCVTCDTEHVYKAGKLPLIRRRKDPAAVPANQATSATSARLEGRLPAPPGGIVSSREVEEATREAHAGGESPSLPEQGEDLTRAPDVEGPVHRPLIRATLPRPEGQVVVRPAPEFTVRQSGNRNGHFRDPDPRGGQRSGRPPGGAAGRPAGHVGHRHAGGPASRRMGREGNGRAQGPRSADRSPGPSRRGRRSSSPPGKKHSK